ncbi:MAG: carboxypeptidase regulatory-like domain-containing protein [Gemmatimonadaceae bacterium]|nr:carboxypeptidase regulatory-like domain-containing protein [Gemmatimonadaceae bacterium]
MSRPVRLVPRLLTALALLPVGAAGLAAQTVRGSVQDAAKRPVVGVVVALLDSTNTVVARALSDERGDFRVVAQRAGTMRLRAQRIGFQATVTEPFALGAGATVTPTVTLEGAQVQLATVRVVASNRCGRADASDAALLEVWEQAQTSLAASLLTTGTRGLTTSIMNVQRVLDPGGKLLDQQLGMRSGNMTAPWATFPIDTLRKRGYVWIDKDDALTYNAPGIDGFVAPQFLDDHCFRLVASKDTSEIGVAFEPAPQRAKASEIRGTFWVQRASAQLQRAEFSFTMPQGVPTPPVPGGGTMRFARLPNGAVIIETWELRMPLTSREQFGGTKTRVDQLQSTGGMVVAIRRGADTLFKRPLVTVSGVVRDSVSGKPLAGASVSLSGTTNRTRSGADGTFQLTDVLPGQYTLAVATPALEAMRASAGSTVVVRDSLAPLVVKVPTEAQIAQTLCGASFSLNKGTGAIVGAVTRTGSTEGLADIPVAADWTELSATSMAALTQGQGKRLQTRTDASGGYRLCGVPVEAALTVRAFPKTGRSQVQSARLGPAQRFATVPIAVDVTLAAASTFRGVVVADSTGTPIAGADVSVSGSDRTARTDDKGAFRIDEVTAGAHEIVVRKLGFSPLNTTLTFAANDEEERRIVLNKLTVLDSVEIIASKPPLRMVEFEENRKVGLGWFLDRTQLERMDGQVVRSALINARNMVFAGGRYPISTHVQMLVKEKDDGSCGPPNALTPRLAEKGGGMICACFPVVFMDGTVRTGGVPSEPFDLNSVAVHQLEAVEWYPSPAVIPAQFQRSGSQCGVLVLHTRMDPGTKKKPGTTP